MNTLVEHGTAWLAPVLAQSRVWVGLCLLAALAGAAAFLAEWQRRATLIALVRTAPAGTVVVQERGRGGPAMQVHVGAPSETDQGETGVTQRGQENVQQVSALWEREAAGLTRYSMVRTGGDRAAADDLVQQAFLAAFLQWEKSLAGLDAEQRRSWLRTVCRRKWIDGIRRETLGNRLQPDVDLLYTQVSEDPAHAVIAREDLDRCWQVIRELSPRRREVALLYFIEQQSEMRIAELLGIQASGVRKHVAKARQALREAVGGLLEAEPVETGTTREGEGESV
ncbi:sigma-70 family RNA polymerase sigma factor [Streptomyces chartreusis]|uniref:RNA polymerase sigma factor n=1 Tax=Streptomyces chartreusis TaxID=1969 RepID=UPI002E819495|nr:sigma-70 family RNA polymerase sigma factor [Streptomyces chartreusis]WUB23813.1 sigma-70 family RNA polymerase sigma factor [Streptomyces chartreusis]